MADHIHTQHIPRAAIIGAGILMLGTLALAGGARQLHLAEAARAAAPAPDYEAYQIRFEDRKDGTLAVLDATSGVDISTVPPGTNGFVRGVLRGMFRSRKLEAIGHEGSFRLAREAGGRLTLTDPQTARRVDLDSFGPTNSQSFTLILESARAARALPMTAGNGP